jgi:protein-tyrosine phosphatase
MVDIHCHILPGIDDDGPSRLEEVLEMARIAVADHIRQIVATPHIKNVVHSPDLVKERVARFNEELLKEGIGLEVLPGAEVSAVLNTTILREHTLNGTDYILLEFPHSHLPQNARQTVFDALMAGLLPIIPHPERNPSIVRRPELLIELVEAGALVQITAESLVGGFGPEARACAIYLLRNKAVHVLATDAHSPTWRPTVLSGGVRAAAKIIGESAARRLVTTNPAAVIAGKALDE